VTAAHYKLIIIIFLKIFGLKLRKVNNWLNRLAGSERVLKRDRVSSPFAKPLITAGTSRWSLWSLLWLWSPAIPVPGPAQLPGCAKPGYFNGHCSEDV